MLKRAFLLAILQYLTPALKHSKQLTVNQLQNYKNDKHVGDVTDWTKNVAINVVNPCII